MKINLSLRYSIGIILAAAVLSGCGKQEATCPELMVESKDTLKEIKLVRIYRSGHRKDTSGSQFYDSNFISGIEGKDYQPDHDRLPSIKTPDEGKILIESAYNKIQLNGHALKLQAAELKSSELIKMLSYAKALTSCSVNCQDTLYAMRIIYGQQDDSLYLYYQPLLLCSNGTTTLIAGKTEQKFNQCNAGGYYFYESKQFKKVTTNGEQNLMNARLSLYKTLPTTDYPYGLEISDAAGSWSPFDDRPDGDLRGSVKSTVFPMKQLIDLSLVSGGYGLTKLWNVQTITKHYYNDSDPTKFRAYIKHELLLSTGNATYTGAILTPGTEFSNMSHICPPRCDTFTFYVVPH